MAKGNIGNLLQHFVAITVAQTVVDAWENSESPIEYVDCFSMNPWEPIDKKVADFRACVSGIIHGIGNDIVSETFRSAFQDHYGDDKPPVAAGFEYPNTAALLRYAFPTQTWNMRLHDVDPDKQGALNDWKAENRRFVSASVNGAWNESAELERGVPDERPTLVMMDPNQFLLRHPSPKKPGFNLSPQLAFSIVGQHRLNLISDDCDGRVARAALLFSYSETSPNPTDREVQARFASRGFNVQRITTSDVYLGKPVTHQGWVIHRGLPALDSMPLQELWDRWRTEIGKAGDED